MLVETARGRYRFNPHGEERRRRVSNHEAAASFETPAVLMPKCWMPAFVGMTGEFAAG
jgi:hypothetical protein